MGLSLSATQGDLSDARDENEPRDENEVRLDGNEPCLSMLLNDDDDDGDDDSPILELSSSEN